MDKMEYLMEVGHKEVVKRIQFDLECAKKALKNAHINVLRLELELQAWLAKQRSEASCTCPPVTYWDEVKELPSQDLPACPIHGTNWVRF